MITISFFTICLSSAYLAWTPRYKHGVVGVICLGFIGISSFVGFLQSIHGEAVFNPISQVIYPALAVFQIRHIYVMHKRQRKCETLIDLINDICAKKEAL